MKTSEKIKNCSQCTKIIGRVLFLTIIACYSGWVEAEGQLISAPNQSSVVASDSTNAVPLPAATTSSPDGATANNSLIIQSAPNVTLATSAQDQNMLGKLFDKAKYENFTQQKSLVIFSIPGNGDADVKSNEEQ